MQDSYYDISVLQQSRRLGDPAVRAKRKELADLLRTCQPLVETSAPLGGVYGGVQGYLTLLDIAAVADDGGATTSLLKSGVSPLGTQSKHGLHLYGGNTLQLAALMEARRSVLALLQNGVDPDIRDADGLSALHSVGTQTIDGLRVIVDLVHHGADLNLRSKNGMTPILMARASDDVRKVECLVLLGATRPSPEEMAALQAESASKSTVDAIDAVLRTGIVNTSSDVWRTCGHMPR
jgi:hypothetical protein